MGSTEGANAPLKRKWLCVNGFHCSAGHSK